MPLYAIVEKPQSPAELPAVPLDDVLGATASIVERVLLERFGRFHPSQPMDTFALYEVLNRTSRWLQSKSITPAWKYELNTIPNMEKDELRIEILASKRFFPMKLCLADVALDMFDEELFFETTPSDLMKYMDALWSLVDDEVQVWNQLVRNRVPELPGRLPYQDIVEDVLYRCSSIIDAKALMDAWNGLEYYNDSWMLASDVLYGFDDWMLLQVYLRNRYLQGVAFVLHEVEMSMFDLRTIDVEDWTLDIIAASEVALGCWNDLVKGG